VASPAPILDCRHGDDRAHHGEDHQVLAGDGDMNCACAPNQKDRQLDTAFRPMSVEVDDPQEAYTVDPYQEPMVEPHEARPATSDAAEAVVYYGQKILILVC
jgi:hypothetical protein